MEELKATVIREIIQTADNFDSNDVAYYVDNFPLPGRTKIGFAWQSKDDGFIHIRHCPRCQVENYKLNEAINGNCYRCGFDPNEQEVPETVYYDK
jgi:hypothetical protein